MVFKSLRDMTRNKLRTKFLLNCCLKKMEPGTEKHYIWIYQHLYFLRLILFLSLRSEVSWLTGRIKWYNKHKNDFSKIWTFLYRYSIEFCQFYFSPKIADDPFNVSTILIIFLTQTSILWQFGLNCQFKMITCEKLWRQEISIL